MSVYREKNSLQLILKDIKLSQEDEHAGFEEEYRAYEADPAYVLPAGAVPSRQDVVDVYLIPAHKPGRRAPHVQSRGGGGGCAATGRPVNFAQLMLSVEILSELNMMISEAGQIYICKDQTCADKANLSKSALWRRVRG